jgi:hypothetical protein
MPITFAALETALTRFRIGVVQPLPTFDKRHLGRQMISLQHFHGFITASEKHVIGPTVRAATQ